MGENDRDRSANGRLPFDSKVRDGVTRQVEAVGRAFDTVEKNASPEAIEELRETTDRLMRACARVLIEIERLRQQS